MAELDEEADHVELTVQRMAELHTEHMERATWLQRSGARLTTTMAQPLVIWAALGAVLAWMLVNVLAPRLGFVAPDPAPFPLLELVATLAAFFTTLLILTTQKLEEEASRHRSQLTLQLASLSEQKIAKVIQLLEEQRRDSPHLASRSDPSAERMAQPADPRHVLERIINTHEDADG